MFKIIKKSLHLALITVAVIILLPVALFPILRIPAVQTYIAQGITQYISRETNSTISIGDIEFGFFNRLIANNILIKDQNNDTLLYTPRITAALNHFNANKGIIVLNRVNIIDPVMALITDSTGTMNLKWYIDRIRNTSDSTGKKRDGLFHISRIELNNGRFSLINRINPPSRMAVDFNNLNLSGIDATVNNLEIRDDSLFMDINKLNFREESGFNVRSMQTEMRINGTSLLFSEAVIHTDSSLINANKINILADSAGSFRRFTDEVKLEIDLRGSSVSLSDLGYYIPFIKGLHDSIGISGRLNGTIAELRGRNISLSYRKETLLDCEFDLSGLPDIENTFIFLSINDFRSISSDIEKIDLPGKGYIEIPEQLKKLGLVSFSGTFTGFTKDFVTYGKINTDKGIISTDISMRPEGDRNFRIKGLIEGSGIDLGTLTGNDLLGNLNIRTNVDGTTNSFKTFSVNLTGMIDSVGINDYLYRNIQLNGNFTDKTWDGNIKIDEENLGLNLLGLFDFSSELPEFDFTLNVQDANLYRLNLDKNDTSSRASLLMTANFRGDNLDNLDGEIKLLNSNFRKYSNNLEVYDFSLKTFTENNVPSIALRTDFADANLMGYYNFTGLGNVARKVMATLLPSRFEMAGPAPEDTGNNFVFDIKLKETTSLNDFLRTGIRITENSMITGSVLQDSVIKITADAGSLMINDNLFRDFQLDAAYTDTTGQIKIKSSSMMMLGGISELKGLELGLKLNPDLFDLALSWDNKEKIINRGAFKAQGKFVEDTGNISRTILTINLMQNDVYVRNNLWKIHPSHIIIDSTSVRFSAFSITNDENYLVIEGGISENPEDTLYLKLNGLNLNPINTLYEKKMGNTPDMLHLSIAGILSGNLSITNVYKNLMFESSLSIHDFALLESQYGEISIGSVWNNENKVADITAYNNYEGKRMFDVSGSYDPDIKNMDLAVRADLLPVDVLNPLLKVFASDISGTATGLVHLSGPLNEPVLTGALYGENTGLKIDYLQTRYTFSDSIRFDRAGIKFRNIQCKDPRGNTATVNGTVFHNSFRDFSVDLTVRTNECMVLDTRSKDNDMFYGTAYASGVTTIKSEGQVLRFDISARTGRNTKFYIPLNSGSSVTENSFVTFISNTNEMNENEEIFTLQTSKPVSTQLEINFDLEVTPEAEVQLIMDPKAGDIMKGTGTGNLNISLDRKGTFKIYGDYMVDDGDYLFTLGNIINKPFSVESGGKISFNGDLEDAEIDIKAIYSTKAALSELSSTLREDQYNEQYNVRLPVDCQLLLSGNLFNPLVKFDINLPTANEEARSYLRSMIQSEEDMSKQVLFLLVMNQFYDADQTRSQRATGIGSATVGVTTMEMLSNQLSNWLSQISNDFDIDVNYRPGSSVLPNSQELQVALSTQVLNDRVSINGNFDVAGSQAVRGNSGIPAGNNSITGAFDIEYAINDKIKFKFFNRSNDNFYIDNGVQYTQGIGLFYRQDFNKFKDLFKKQEKGEMKKEEDAKIENE